VGEGVGHGGVCTHACTHAHTHAWAYICIHTHACLAEEVALRWVRVRFRAWEVIAGTHAHMHV
jgi:hypothetical protein